MQPQWVQWQLTFSAKERATGADDIVARFNELLNSLREAGLLRLP